MDDYLRGPQSPKCHPLPQRGEYYGIMLFNPVHVGSLLTRLGPRNLTQHLQQADVNTSGKFPEPLPIGKARTRFGG